MLHYLKAVDALKSKDDREGHRQDEGDAHGRSALGKGSFRPMDGQIHPMYLFEVKKPSESTGEWDLYKTLATIPADEAFRPMDEGGCPLVKS